MRVQDRKRERTVSRTLSWQADSEFSQVFM
jgi:hypothetical protein